MVVLNGHLLAQIMTQRRQHQPQGIFCLFSQLRRLIQNQHGVVPHIPLGVKLRLLGNADEGLYLREPAPQLTHLPQYLKEDGRPGRFQQRFFQLAQDSLAGKGSQIHPGAEGNGFLRHRKTEPGRELGRPQHPQGVFGKGDIVDMAYNSPLQILLTAEVVHDFAGEHILHQGVHGKIPPLSSLLGAQKGICKGRKIPMASAGSLLSPGHGNVQVIVFKTINAEAGAHLCTLP